MTIAAGGRNLPIGAVVAAVGGALAVIGSVLAWESVSVLGYSDSSSGISSNPGKIIVVAGIVAVALAVAWIMEKKVPAAGGIVACGAVVALLGVLNFFSIGDDVNKANVILAGAASIGIGLFVDIIAGVVIIVGGALGLMKKAA
jgi:hypothetical protein